MAAKFMDEKGSCGQQGSSWEVGSKGQECEKAQQRYHLYKKTGEKLGEGKLRTLAEIVYINFM